jgi:hypothetical protein
MASLLAGNNAEAVAVVLVANRDLQSSFIALRGADAGRFHPESQRRPRCCRRVVVVVMLALLRNGLVVNGRNCPSKGK